MSLIGIEPKEIWNNFSALNEVPRPSKKEEKVIAFITAKIGRASCRERV